MALMGQQPSGQPSPSTPQQQAQITRQLVSAGLIGDPATAGTISNGGQAIPGYWDDMSNFETPAYTPPAGQPGLGGMPAGQPPAQPAQPNIYQQSAGAYNGALGATQGAMQRNAMSQPMLAQTAQGQATTGSATTYNPFTGMNADGSAMAGFGAGNAAGGGYTASTADNQVAAGQFAGMDISPYLNPYTQNVVDQTQADMERARLIQQNQADDAMQAAGAFGGSRHGIANAETNRAYYDRLGATTGALRNQGYQNAQQAAFTDIGNTMRADLANQAQDQFNASAKNQAGMTGANNATSASIANANNQSQLAAQRLGAVNDAARFGASAFNDMSRFNAGSMNDMSRFNAGNLTDTSRFNAGAYNNFQNNQFGNQMAGANQLAGLSQLGFNMGNNISGMQAADGAQAQAIQQQLMNLAQQQFNNYTGTGNVGLANLQTGVASAPGASNTTTTENPGLFGILGSIAALPGIGG